MIETTLSKLQHKAIAALITSQRFSSTAVAVNVPERTLHRWIMDRDFRTAFITDGGNTIDGIGKGLRLDARFPHNSPFLLLGYLLIPIVLCRFAQAELEYLLILRAIVNLDRRITRLEEKHWSTNHESNA